MYYRVLPTTGAVGIGMYANYYLGIGLTLIMVGIISFRLFRLIKNER